MFVRDFVGREGSVHLVVLLEVDLEASFNQWFSVKPCSVPDGSNVLRF